jgi:hypothetical protein
MLVGECVLGGCSDWQCYDAFSTRDTNTNSVKYNNSDCGDNKFDYTNDDLVFATIISAMGGLAIGIVITWMALFSRYSYRKIHEEEERRSLTTTQSPIAGLDSGTSDSAAAAAAAAAAEENKS